jgi:hypothetical protein
MPTFHYTVDDEPQTTDQHELKANQLLPLAGLDAAVHYLIELLGSTQKQLQGDEPVHMHEDARFISVFTGPVPVS